MLPDRVVVGLCLGNGRHYCQQSLLSRRRSRQDRRGSRSEVAAGSVLEGIDVRRGGGRWRGSRREPAPVSSAMAATFTSGPVRGGRFGFGQDGALPALAPRPLRRDLRLCGLDRTGLRTAVRSASAQPGFPARPGQALGRLIQPLAGVSAMVSGAGATGATYGRPLLRGRIDSSSSVGGGRRSAANIGLGGARSEGNGKFFVGGAEQGRGAKAENQDRRRTELLRRTGNESRGAWTPVPPLLFLEGIDAKGTR